ncbi:MAG: polyprenyl synthetase family protein [Elusimicrobiota bacterium]|jgi:geranylgeranyl diphosphate synthase type II|nr:polyprenyl synthetase family protein [Elusimicrobiota bacterium]
MDNKTLTKELKKNAVIINAALKKFLPKDNSLISQTMRYAVLNGGKRLRPFLVITAAELVGGNIKFVLPAACALEYVHSYSLVHDDLPAMDNDDLRRGKPTTHKKFGEAAAILCGDALLTESFKLIIKSQAKAEYKNIAVGVLADFAGYQGMVGGQVEDTLETDGWKKKRITYLSEKLLSIEAKKTSALLTASLYTGAVLSGANEKQKEAFLNYGFHIGCAFQIADDILDVYADKKLLGKKGSDKDNNKLTALSLFGKEGAQEKASSHIKAAKAVLKTFGKKADILRALADYIVDRTY